jgi:hypothetical protein
MSTDGRSFAAVTARRGVAGQRQAFEPDPGERAERVLDSPGGLRRRGGIAACPFGVVGEHGQVQRAFAGEVGVDRAPGQVGLLGDPIDLGLDVAVLLLLRTVQSRHHLMILSPSR